MSYNRAKYAIRHQRGSSLILTNMYSLFHRDRIGPKQVPSPIYGDHTSPPPLLYTCSRSPSPHRHRGGLRGAEERRGTARRSWSVGTQCCRGVDRSRRGRRGRPAFLIEHYPSANISVQDHRLVFAGLASKPPDSGPPTAPYSRQSDRCFLP